MRLIDADALKEKMKCTNRYFSIKFDIDEAPTIDPEALPIVQELRKRLAKVTAERDALKLNPPTEIDSDIFELAVQLAKVTAERDELKKNVRPVVRGRWVDGEASCPICGESKFKGLDADIWADWQPPFCPNCGADMRGDPK